MKSKHNWDNFEIVFNGKPIKTKSINYKEAINIANLESDLKFLVIDEKYEEAALLRDRIEKAKQEL